ncbi:MAG TPA: hypothetical protein VF518_02745, partial [Polyangia bacterium]
MGPSAQIDDSSQAICIQVSTGGVKRIQRCNRTPQPLLKGGKLFGHLLRPYALLRAYPYPSGPKSRFAAQPADVVGVGHLQPRHGVRLPFARGFDGWNIPAKGA